MSFNVIVSDCPWRFGDKLPGVRGAESHYETMSTSDLCELELPDIAGDAILFQWAVSSMLEDALVVTSAWGFTVKTTLTWVKTKKGVEGDVEDVGDLAFGMGRSLRGASETCLVATRGKYTPLIVDHGIRNVFFAPRGEHSQKPDKFYELVEQLTGHKGSYLELFARRPRSNWSCLGDALGHKFAVKESA